MLQKLRNSKSCANDAFNARKYAKAIDLYSQAIEVNSQNAVYWANRAFAHIKLEEYGSAIQDATKAIEVDPKYSKGYYRRGAAHLAMGKFKEALKDFQQRIVLSTIVVAIRLELGTISLKVGYLILNLPGQDLESRKYAQMIPDATKKLKECEKAVMKLKFEEAISVPESERRSIADSIDFHSIGKGPNSSVSTEVAIATVTVAVMAVVVMLVKTSKTTVAAAIVVGLLVLGACWWSGCKPDVEPQYSGARIEGDVVTLDFVKKMLDDFKNQKCLHKRYAFQIVLQTREILHALPSLVDIKVLDGKHFTVCGDVHGQKRIHICLTGDFVDRGSFSLEVILTLFAFKCMSPSAIYLARGNHESKSMNKIYGFEGEVRSKLNDTFVELFSEVFCYLPLAHVINEKVFVVHGGLFSVDGVKLSDIRAINRFCEPPEEGLMCELLWSDPQPLPGRGPSKRGVGLSFGADVTKRFLQENNLDLVVRSHEVKDEGYEIEHDGKLITVFSAPNYCDQMGNKGAFIRFEAPEMKPNIVTFSAVSHPDVKPMAYANNFLRMFQ
ncbi:Serine/threonine-protein phosphatase [Quillaja saponaria]|uniref:Serine/threonine-protein phosphatase 5 n=1 Tax=Quillaja saponaria TaxID=32244 RepID=A0AAD7PMJ8_QUISA|nr:Serine/threonine-protein phosphatase [Quillaja saponaria]